MFGAALLRVHFLNVGHGDCTIIEHPSGRLTMVDVNNSQEFDSATFAEELDEERAKLSNSFGSGLLSPYLFGSSHGVGPGSSLGALSEGNALQSNPFGGILSTPPTTGLGLLGGLSEYGAVFDRQKRELTDPIEFMKRRYPNRSLWRFILTHPDLDHMRGLKNLVENIGFDNFWDTKHTKECRWFGARDRDGLALAS
jgi:competence protein ComEC